MSQQTNLQLLISALAANEKKEFFQHITSFYTPQQLQHCKLLCKQPYLSSSEIEKQLNLNDRQYKAACETIYNSLCLFPLSNKETNSVLHQLQKMQLLGEIQKEKGLFAEAQKIVVKAIAIARHYELCYVEIQLQHQHLQIMAYMQAQLNEEFVSSCQQRINLLIVQQTIIERLQLIYHQLVILRYKLPLRMSAAEQQEIVAIRHQLQDSIPDGLVCRIAHIYFYQATLLADFMLTNTENIIAYNQSLLYCWQQQGHLIPLYAELFIRSVSTQAYTHFLSGEVELVSSFMEQYRQLASKYLQNQWYKDWFDIVDFHTSFKVFHKTYQYELLDKYFNGKWPSVYKKLHVLREPERIDILLSSCITCFVLQQWEEAEALLLDVKEMNRRVKRNDMLYFSFIFHCLILYEKKEWSLLQNLIETEYHFLYSNKALRPFEKDMLLFIKKLPVLTIKGKGKAGMETFLKKLDTYRGDQLKKLHFAYFDFYSWIESKIKGMTYTALLKEKAMHYEMHSH